MTDRAPSQQLVEKVIFGQRLRDASQAAPPAYMTEAAVQAAQSAFAAATKDGAVPEAIVQSFNKLLPSSGETKRELGQQTASQFEGILSRNYGEWQRGLDEAQTASLVAAIKGAVSAAKKATEPALSR